MVRVAPGTSGGLALLRQSASPAPQPTRARRRWAASTATGSNATHGASASPGTALITASRCALDYRPSRGPPDPRRLIQRGPATPGRRGHREEDRHLTRDLGQQVQFGGGEPLVGGDHEEQGTAPADRVEHDPDAGHAERTDVRSVDQIEILQQRNWTCSVRRAEAVWPVPARRCPGRPGKPAPRGDRARRRYRWRSGRGSGPGSYPGARSVRTHCRPAGQRYGPRPAPAGPAAITASGSSGMASISVGSRTSLAPDVRP